MDDKEPTAAPNDIPAPPAPAGPNPPAEEVVAVPTQPLAKDPLDAFGPPATEEKPSPAPAKNAEQLPKGSDVPPAAPHHGHTPVGVIVFAIIVAIGLGALTVFTFLKSDDSLSNKPSSVQSSQTTPAKAADLETASQNVDTALAGIDSNDFVETDLSDSSLGLQ